MSDKDRKNQRPRADAVRKPSRSKKHDNEEMSFEGSDLRKRKKKTNNEG